MNVVGFEVLMAINDSIWDGMPCGLVGSSPLFPALSVFRVGVTHSSKMLMTVHHSTQRYIPNNVALTFIPTGISGHKKE